MGHVKIDHGICCPMVAIDHILLGIGRQLVPLELGSFDVVVC